MKNFYYLILILFSFQLVYAQNNLLTKEEIDSLYKTNELVYPDDEEDVKKLEELIKTSKEINYKDGIIDGKMRLLSFLSFRSDYKAMLKLISEIETLGLRTDYQQLARLYMYKSVANNALGIEREALQNLQDALKHANKIEGDKGHLEVSYVYNAIGTFYNDKSPDSVFYYQKKELEELEQISDKESNKIKISIALSKINLGKSYLVLRPNQLDLAEPYFMDAYNYKATRPDVFEELDMPILCGVADFYFYKEDYKKSLELLNEVLQREKRKSNPFYRSYAYSVLTDVYEGLGNSKEQAKYAKLYAALNDSINLAAKKEVSQQFDKLVTNAEVKKEKEYSSNLKMILTGVGCFILILSLTTWFFWQRKNKNIHKKYEAIISKIKAEKDYNEILTESQEEIEDIEIKSTITIPDDTVKTLLRKLEKFEKSKLYLQQDMSVVWLSSHLGTNIKYLSELLKIYRNKNFTNYINGLKINYVLNKLVNDPLYRQYKITYLAEECGYASRQVFLSAFKKETGFTPSYFIENLKKEGSKLE